MRVLVAVMVVLLAGCIPVRVMPSDKAILVAPVGVQAPQADGTTALNPTLPQPKAEDYKPGVGALPWMQMLLSVVGLVLGGTGVGVVALPFIAKLKTALAIAAQLADANAAAATDAEVAAAKRSAAMAQTAAGVQKLTQRVRGKAA